MDVIDTSVMPGDDIDPDALDTAAGQIRSSGKSVNGSATATHTAWQKLSGVYEAPEQADLYHAMNPVKTEGETFAYDLDLGASALETFAETVRTIKAAVVKIRAAATAFEAKISDDGTIEAQTMVAHVGMVPVRKQWNEDHGMVDDQKQIAGDMSAQWEALRTAEIACANSLNHITGAPQIPSSGPGAPPPAPKIAEAQWYLNAPVDRKENCGEQIAHAVVIDFAGGIVSGVVGFVGLSWSPTTGKFGNWWDTFSSSWSGLNKLVTALDPVMIGLDHLPDPDPGAAERAQTRAAFFGGQVSLDPYAADPEHRYKEAPYRAWTNSVLNVGSWLLPPLKVVMAGKLAKAGEVAGDAAKASDLAKATEATRFASAADLVKALRESSSLATLGKASDVLKARVGNIFGRSSPLDASLHDLESPKLSSYDLTTHHADPHPVTPPVRDLPSGNDHSGHPRSPAAGSVSDASHRSDREVSSHERESGDHRPSEVSPNHPTTDQPGGPDVGHPSEENGHPADAQSTPDEYELPEAGKSVWRQVSEPEVATHDVTIKKHADSLTALAEKTSELQKLADEQGVDTKRLTAKYLDRTIEDLKLKAETPVERAQLEDLKDAARAKIEAHVDVAKTGENLGNSATRDIIKSLKDDLVYGLKDDERGQPRTFDGLSVSRSEDLARIWEAKGGDSAELGTAKVDGAIIKQGSTEYANYVLKNDPEIGEFLRKDPEFVARLKTGDARLQYIAVKAKMDGRVRVTVFDLRVSELDLDAFVKADPVSRPK